VAENSTEFSVNCLLQPEAVAKILRKSLPTLARWRCDGFGPAFVKIGGSVTYLPSDVQVFLLAQRRESTAENHERQR
jgi:Helix-turn-helix domain